ncbi:anti-sigma F factor [Clostridia bacterium]|nr:anti-sigma F factor [Clostridia bacterium]
MMQEQLQASIKSETFKLEMESKSHNEEFARVVVAVFMTRLDPTLEEIEDVKTAVSEAVTNAVIHGYQGKEGKIYLEVSAKDKTLCVCIRDEGVGIEDIAKAMEPLYTSLPSGERSGMGFSFMEAFMDEVLVESKPGEGTTIKMKKTMGQDPFE